ncbi:hypothetical protein DRN67_03970 [Candidatus Micrarchaeota archaeon]|nr:MAG: hypothetical protein DRN67_03970 [Candidatus Micrarchaeota archaeon]
MLQLLFRSKAEVAVLGIVLFSEGLHLREISRRAGISPSEAKRELDTLVQAGVLIRTPKGNLSTYALNEKCPFLNDLRNLYLRTEGTIPLLAKKFSKISGLRYAFVYGSFASGRFTERSDVDLMVIGDVDPDEIDAACFAVQKSTLNEINYIIWSEEDFRKKAKEQGAFTKSITKKEKIWLVGDEDEFERDVKKA